MSEAAAALPGEGAFRFRTVVILLAVGIVGFLGTLVLSAYAPGLRSGRNGGAHALSDAAVGYSGLVRLLDATGRNPRIIRDEDRFGSDNLLVLTPEDGAVNISKPLALRVNKPTLIILPKWMTAGDPVHGGWVRRVGLTGLYDPEGVLAPATRLHLARHRSGGAPLVSAPELGAIRFGAPRPLQVIKGFTPVVEKTEYGTRTTGTLHPLITDGAGGVVLARIDNMPRYVLADPELLANRGMRRESDAAAAVALLDWLGNATPDTNTRDAPTGIDFDVTLNGLGRGKSPLRLAFEPPGLAMTLSLLAALLLAGWHAFGRFGTALPRPRALAFGKAALVDNAAALVRKAGRQGRLGGRYAAVMRARAAGAMGVSARVRGEALDGALDRLGGRRRFSELAAAATNAQDPRELLAAARALHEWQGGGRA